MPRLLGRGSGQSGGVTGNICAVWRSRVTAWHHPTLVTRAQEPSCLAKPDPVLTPDLLSHLAVELSTNPREVSQCTEKAPVESTFTIGNILRHFTKLVFKNTASRQEIWTVIINVDGWSSPGTVKTSRRFVGSSTSGSDGAPRSSHLAPLCPRSPQRGADNRGQETVWRVTGGGHTSVNT